MTDFLYIPTLSLGINLTTVKRVVFEMKGVDDYADAVLTLIDLTENKMRYRVSRLDVPSVKASIDSYFLGGASARET